MNVEDIFLSVVDRSDEKKPRVARGERRKRSDRTSAENEIGAELFADAKRQREEAALENSEEDEV